MGSEQHHATRPEVLPRRSLANLARQWLVWLLARLRIVSAFHEAMATRKYTFSNTKLKEELGVRPRTLDESIRDTLISMVEGGWVQAKANGGAPPV